MNHDQNGAELMTMLHNRSGRELTWRLHRMRDTRAPGASPYVDEITLSPDESGIYDAFGRLRQCKQDRDWTC